MLLPELLWFLVNCKLLWLTTSEFSNFFPLWDKPQSDKPLGWYYATVKEYYADGEALIEHANSTTKKLKPSLISGNWLRKASPLSSPPSKNLKDSRRSQIPQTEIVLPSYC